MTAEEKSQQILQKRLTKEDFEKFINSEPISIILKHRLYVLHKIDNNMVIIRQDGRADPGYIKQDSLSKLYDSVAAFISNVEYRGVEWGCGNMSLQLPSSMPPRDLSFTTYIENSSPVIYDGLKRTLNIISRAIPMIAVFPSVIGYYLIADGTNSTADFIAAVGLASFACAAASFVLSIFITNGYPDWGTFMLFFMYLAGLGYVGAFYGRYMKWRKRWEVKE